MLYTIHRYPAEWIDRWTMHDGSIATVRPILPQDAPLEAALVEGLSSESRYARFLVGGGRLSDEMLAAYTQIDYVNHMALVVSVARPDGTGENLIADGRFVLEDGVAEFAMLVADAWQGKGVGRRLFATLVRAARDRPGTRCGVPCRRRAGRCHRVHRAPAAGAGRSGYHPLRFRLIVPSSRACTPCRCAYRVSLSPPLCGFFFA